MAKQQVSGPYRVQPLEDGRYELMEMENKQFIALRPRKVYDKRPSAYQEMVRMNRRWLIDWGHEEAMYYHTGHPEEHLREQALEQRADEEMRGFKRACEEQDGVELNEEAMKRFRKEWIKIYKHMEWIEADMEANPQDYDEVDENV